jgi:uncharacterized protein
MSEKLVSKIMQKMIAYSDGNLHDIAHFIKVHSFARTIGILEGLGDSDQQTLEIAAILHDIACPLCREKYGNTNGKYQEKEGGPLTQNFLKDFDLPDKVKTRIIFLVSHHHTYTDVEGLDYQILLEADFLVNADESAMSTEAIENAREKIFKTKSGIDLLEKIYFAEKKSINE